MKNLHGMVSSFPMKWDNRSAETIEVFDFSPNSQPVYMYRSWTNGDKWPNRQDVQIKSCFVSSSMNRSHDQQLGLLLHIHSKLNFGWCLLWISFFLNLTMTTGKPVHRTESLRHRDLRVLQFFASASTMQLCFRGGWGVTAVKKLDHMTPELDCS